MRKLTTEEFVLKAQAKHGEKYDYSCVAYTGALAKVRIACRTHGEFLQTPNNHLNGAGCPACKLVTLAEKFTMPQEEFISRAIVRHGDRFDYSKVRYAGAKEKVTLICQDHGEFNVAPYEHLNGTGCPLCSGRGRLTTEEFVRRAAVAHGERYDYREARYVNAKTPVVVLCKEHGAFRTLPYAHVHCRTGCPVCGSIATGAARKLDTAEFVRRAKAVHGDTYDYVKTCYAAGRESVTIVCKRHGEFEQKASSHVQGHGCPECNKGGPEKMELAEFIARATAVHGGKFTYEKAQYVTATAPVEITCPDHGSFWQSAHAHLIGKVGCVQCGAGTSKAEASIADWLESLGETVVRRDRTTLAPKELDIWLPERKLAVEFHGCYWHTEDRVGNSHRVKWELADKAGIGLIQVFEDEWTDKQDIVKSRILARLGKLPKLGARRCEVVDLSWVESRAFLDKTHLQGAGPYGAVCLGLKHNGEICAVATFGRSRTGSMVGGGEDWEVLRYAADAAIAGGFGKLFAEFRKRHTPSRIISYCDLRYGTGGLYKACGFVLESISQPDYWWYPTKKSNVRIPRYRTQKHKLKTHPELKGFYKDELSEREICESAGWKRIFGVGNQKWIFTP